MRLQLISRVLCFVALLLLLPKAAEAQIVHVDTTHTFFYEAPTRTNMFVYTPAVDARVSPWEWLAVKAGWEADMVTGASVSVKAGPAYKATQVAADVVSAASVTDFRNVVNGAFTLKKDTVTVDGGYTYSTENDYKSHAMNLSARTELFEHNTIFQLDYARNFDLVCDRTQGSNDTFSRFVAMENSKGCWSGPNDPNRPLRVTKDLGIDSMQGSWSQAWTPIFQTQLAYTLQVANGFQSNPYRSIILGQGIKGQEHHPDNRARHAVSVRGALYIKPIKAAARVGLRGYWDSWNIASGTFEAEFEKYIGERLRVNVRGRIYKQTGALFWSDDYTGGDRPLGPKGQYWTGDRELSPFWSALVGLRVSYVMTPHQDKKILGFLQEMKISGSADLMQFFYEEYTLPPAPPAMGKGDISNARAIIAGGNVGFAF